MKDSWPWESMHLGQEHISLSRGTLPASPGQRQERGLEKEEVEEKMLMCRIPRCGFSNRVCLMWVMSCSLTVCEGGSPKEIRPHDLLGILCSQHGTTLHIDLTAHTVVSGVVNGVKLLGSCMTT